MTSETEIPTLLSLKRLFLIIITILVGVMMGQSLISSWNEPQVASQLQLYQTDLLLQGSAWEGDFLPKDQRQVIREGLLGKNPVETALKQYEEVSEEAESAVGRISQELEETSLALPSGEGKPLPRRLQTTLDQQQLLVNQLNVRIGLLNAVQGNESVATDRWQQVIASETASAALKQTATDLTSIWRGSPAPNAAAQIGQTLDGWFRYRALEQLYQVEGRTEAVGQLLAEEQAAAESQLLKLALVGTLPAVGALAGAGLLVFLLLQRLTKGPDSLLMRHAGVKWDIPWNGEIIWQVLVVGFFFVGQIVLPLLLGSLGIASGGLSSRGKAFYSMVYYLLMATGGISVLVWSIRTYRPLPADLFQFKLKGSGILWGLGGYLVALPLMLGVALINQQIWQGQGGSNPLLQTVLEEQDWVALGLFFFTAAIAAPLFEELLFRGFLLPSLTRYLPVWGAVGLSALIFAAAHLSLSEVLPLTALGMMLGFVYTRSRNLLAPMLLHSAWNSVTMVGLLILGNR